MKIVYMSASNNIQNYLKKAKIDEDSLILLDFNSYVSLDGEKYILIVPTYDPPMSDPIFDFMEDNSPEDCLGVIGSGDKNFGKDLYCYTARDVCEKFNVPHLFNIEKDGFQYNIDDLLEFIEEN